MSGHSGFRDLEAWQISMVLAEKAYAVAAALPVSDASNSAPRFGGLRYPFHRMSPKGNGGRAQCSEIISGSRWALLRGNAVGAREALEAGGPFPGDMGMCQSMPAGLVRPSQIVAGTECWTLIPAPLNL